MLADDAHLAGVGNLRRQYDNALCESFFATLECELLERRSFRSHAEARMAIFEFVEGFDNRRRHPTGLITAL